MNKDVAEVSQAYQVEAAEQSLPVGYKQTEVGVTNSSGANLNATSGGPQGGGMDSRRIPEGWEGLAFADVLTIRHGKDQKAVETLDGQFPIFGTGGQMGWASEYLYDKPSVLIGRKGTINKPRYMETPFWTVDTLFYSEIKKGFSAKFVFYKFCMINWEQHNEASGVPSLNARTIEKVTALFPTYKEQTVIANALSDTDALLNELEKLIAKKQAIKTATMQQLLTGRTRLPQFAQHQDGSPKGYKQSELGEIPEDWEVSHLLDNTLLIHGKAHEQFVSQSGEFVVVNSKFVSTEGRTRKYCTVNFCPAKAGDVLMVLSDLPNGRALAKCFYTDLDNTYAVNQRVCVFRAIKFYSKFLFYLLNRYEYFLAIDDGVTQTHILNGDIASCLIYGPKGIEEQTAIATVLSDIDTELQALEHRLNKTRQIKQGMMQELLTGKTRLVQPIKEKY